MTLRDKESYSIQAVENALNILEALGEEGDDIRLSQLSEKLGLNKTSVFRLMATFENRGYVEQEPESGKYRLGLSAYEVAQKLLSRNTLLLQARPVLERLARACDEATYIAVRHGGDILFLDAAETMQQVKVVSFLGKRLPLSATAAGRIFLAYPPNGESELKTQRSPSANLLPGAEELHLIRRQKYCVDEGGIDDGIVCAATPLFNDDGRVVSALCIIGPAFRVTDEKLHSGLLHRLKEAGEVISSKLGYLPPHLKHEGI